jgi:type I restriction enzyme S subunit
MRNDWKTTKLSLVVKEIKPGYPSGKHNTSGQGVMHFRPYNISTNGGVDVSQKKYAPLKSNEYYLESGDIIFNNTNSPKLLGKTCHISHTDNWTYSNHMTRIRVKDNIDSKYISLYLHLLFYSGFYQAHCANHVNQASISSTFLKKNLDIPLAALPEQRAIVIKIEQLFSELDNGIANLKAAQNKLHIYRQAVLKKAFEGELTKQWREQQSDLPTADELLEQIKQERQRHYAQQLADWEQAVVVWEVGGKEGKKPSKPRKTKEFFPLSKRVLSEITDLPVIWKSYKLGDVVDQITDGPFGSNLKTSDYVTEGIRVIRLENIKSLYFDDTKKSFITKEKYETLKKHSVFPGDVIFSSFISEQTKVACVPSTIDVAVNKADCFRIHCGKTLDHKFVEYYLSTRKTYNQLVSLVHGATRPRINTTQLKEIIFPLCSFEEQTQIVQQIESRLSVCDNLSATIKQSLEQAEALRQSILKKAFEGRLLSVAEMDACRAERDWEPAAQLLARIQQERGL